MRSLENLKKENPFSLFQNWLKEAQNRSDIANPYAMVLSTTHTETFLVLSFIPLPTTKVSNRVVLFKGLDSSGEKLLFYTNYKSQKCKKLGFLGSHDAAINFYWPSLKKQICMEGLLKKTSRKESLNYWNTRSRESQISQYISKQSSPLKDRKTLTQEWEKVRQSFSGRPIPCPKHWGGMTFRPSVIEFWKEQAHRLHERLYFKKTLMGNWKSSLLYP